MRRLARCSAILSLAICGKSGAITLYGFDTGADATTHTTAPTGTISYNSQTIDLSNSGWKYQVNFVAGNPVSGTAIGPHAFITAGHVAPTPGTVVSYGDGAGTATVSGSVSISGRDLSIVTVTGNLPYWAPIYNTATDGSVVGKVLVDMGRGTQRGDPINQSPARNGTTLRGWVWGNLDSKRRWGTNVVNDVTTSNFNGNNDEFIRYTFDRNGLTDECTISGGDSGGGVFIQGAGGIWKLAAANSFVSPSGFRYSPTTPNTPVDPLPSSCFDYSDLYLQASDSNYYQAQLFFPGQQPIPQQAYVSNVSDLSTSIYSAYVPHAGDVNTDGKVNALDFNVISSNFGLSSGAVWTQGDLNFDGKVNAADFTILASNFGYSGAAPDGVISSAALAGLVPEPSTLAAVAIGGLLLRRRSR